MFAFGDTESGFSMLIKIGADRIKISPAGTTFK